PRAPRATLSPYTTLFRSGPGDPQRAEAGNRPVGRACVDPQVGGRSGRVVARRAEFRWSDGRKVRDGRPVGRWSGGWVRSGWAALDRKSTRLNSSHVKISY